MKLVQTLLLLSTVASASLAHAAWQWDSINPVTQRADVPKEDFYSQWPGFMPSGTFSGQNPLPGCMIYGPYASTDTVSPSLLSANLRFARLNLGSHAQHTCRRTDRLRGCTSWDNRSTPGAITVDVTANINGQGPRPVGISQRTLAAFPQNPDGSVDLSLLGNQSIPAGSIYGIELRVCNHVGVDQANVDIQFNGGTITITQ